MSSSEALARGGEASWDAESQLGRAAGKLGSEGRKLSCGEEEVTWGVWGDLPSRLVLRCACAGWGPALVSVSMI